MKYAWIDTQRSHYALSEMCPVLAVSISGYASGVFQDKLVEYGMTCSMSRKGNCWDNAPTESWFNSFKNERVHGWRFATREDMTATAFEYIEVFYNRKRLHSTLGYKSPTQFLQDWFNKQPMKKQVA